VNENARIKRLLPVCPEIMTSDKRLPSAGEDSANETANASKGAVELIEGMDYYIEAGLFVFTARFLRNRGYCCENSCRHLYSITRSVSGTR
jgi:hypothetical protein